jgi:hypothetical protein
VDVIGARRATRVSSRRQKSLQRSKRATAGTFSLRVKVLSGSEKLPLGRDFQADARTRTGDPFITSDEPMSAPVRSSHPKPLSKGGFADRSGLEVTGADNMVDG